MQPHGAGDVQPRGAGDVQPRGTVGVQLHGAGDEQPHCAPSEQLQASSLGHLNKLSTSRNLDSHNLPVKGRLKSHRLYWKTLGVDPFIYNLLETGYKMRFVSKAPIVHLANNRSAIKKISLLQQK